MLGERAESSRSRARLGRLWSSRLALGVLAFGLIDVPLTLAATGKPPTMADVLAASKANDWRPLDPESTLYMELPTGRVVIELAPELAPEHVANVRTMVRAKYFDGLAILRAQENYVVQWGDPNSGKAGKARPLGAARPTLPPEMFRAAKGLPFVRLDSRDPYANEVGFVDGFPVGRDSAHGRAWLAHCYGMVGAGRDTAPDSGNGAELYVVIGHAPRHLDRNVALLGRVISGMELLTTLPRGRGELGFYETAEERTTITRVRLAADLPPEKRVAWEVLRTDTPTFARLIESRRNRREEWFLDPVGSIELCNVPLPARVAPAR